MDYLANIRLKAAMMHVVDAAGEKSERLGHLQPFRGIFECSVDEEKQREDGRKGHTAHPALLYISTTPPETRDLST